MDKLPPELLLKIAGYCDCAEVYALSKVNKQWNELIESNWNTLKKARVECITLSQDGYEKDVKCGISCFGLEKGLAIKVSKGSEDGNASEALENGWMDVRPNPNNLLYDCENFVVSPKDVGKYVEDLFTPIFRQSKILVLRVLCLESSTLQVLISLLERFRPMVGWLVFFIGSNGGHVSLHDVQELLDSTRIVELCKPGRLDFVIRDYFTQEDVCERFMKNIANLDIPCVRMVYSEGPNCYYTNPAPHRPSMHGPLPKCKDLSCLGSGYEQVSALAIPDIVDLVEEWSNNERDIMYYELTGFPEDIRIIAANFEQALQERNLPVQFEVVEENAEFLIEKIATRGDNQDQLQLEFVLSGHVDYDSVIIRTKEGQRLPFEWQPPI